MFPGMNMFNQGFPGGNAQAANLYMQMMQDAAGAARPNYGMQNLAAMQGFNPALGMNPFQNADPNAATNLAAFAAIFISYISNPRHILKCEKVWPAHISTSTEFR